MTADAAAARGATMRAWTPTKRECFNPRPLAFERLHY